MTDSLDFQAGSSSGLWSRGLLLTRNIEYAVFCLIILIGTILPKKMWVNSLSVNDQKYYDLTLSEELWQVATRKGTWYIVIYQVIYQVPFRLASCRSSSENVTLLEFFCTYIYGPVDFIYEKHLILNFLVILFSIEIATCFQEKW